MSETPDSLPDRDQELALHGRLLAGDDPTATVDLAVAYLTPLIKWLSTSNKEVSEDFRNHAAGDAILTLAKNPRSYDPNRGMTLFGFLKMSAKGDLLNLLRDENRHQKNRKLVELSSLDGKYLKEADPSVSLRIHEKLEIARAEILPVVRNGLSEAELRVLDLMLADEKKTAALAQAYGIGDLPHNEQKREIKRVTDKLKKRIERARNDNG
jgi:DNA-directed RNA polymerase specialized sigma subunit